MAIAQGNTDLFLEYRATRSPILREKLVLNSVSLVHFILARLGIVLEMGPDYDDLANQGLLALVESIDRYDPAYGTQFSTYASLRIRGKIIDYLRSLDWLSRTARRRARTVQAAVDELYIRNQETPTNREVANFLGISESQIDQALVDANQVILSLDALQEPNAEDGETAAYEILADTSQPDPAEVVFDRDQKQQLLRAIRELPEREKLILSLYYYEEKTLKEIGQVLNVSESRVCQLHARAMLTLKNQMENPETPARKFHRHTAVLHSPGCAA
ncbi:MAG TPA: FliA/WhiG family RNA polymerase sigma factor [Anaerolineales bacterium]